LLVIKRIAYRILLYMHGLKFYRLTLGKLTRKRVQCRVATEADAAVLSRIYGSEAFLGDKDPIKTYAKRIRNLKGWGHFLIATTGKKAVGAVVIRRFSEDVKSYPDWWIFSMLVHVRYRRLGIGKELLRLAVQKAAERGAKRINLWVFEDNRAAINLYYKMGFQRDSIPGLDEQIEEEVRQGKRRRIIMSITPGSSAT
jgi:ribosomal protein S18 acetylase RimI-like enzyme